MTRFEPGDVILVPFPFSDLTGVKKRPALVLADIEDGHEVICLMLTSVELKSEKHEYSIINWKEAGLLKPSIARIHRLFTLHRNMVNKKLGRLVEEEYITIIQRVIDLLANKA
jgi:mRNA interferase MazF